MLKKILITASIALFITGCASVPMESSEISNQAKQFEDPEEGNAGLYIYRDSFVGKALKKDVWVNDECVGESASSVFFYKQVPGNEEYIISTESEFSPNSLSIMLEQGKNYFIRQYIKLGVFVGGADLEIIEPEKAKESIAKLELAKSGVCSKPFVAAEDSDKNL